MKTFMGKNFLLTTDTAKELFHDYAENMPIIDYHCHINPKEIYEDRKFENISGQRLLRRQSAIHCITGAT